MISSKLVVKRYSSRTSFEGIQCLIREWRLFGLKVWSTKVAQETVPSWAAIQAATLGSTDWRSKFAEFI